MSREHAMLSASGSEMWINCPPSARLCDAEEETTTSYAEEGTLAHSIGELKLRKALVAPMPKSTFRDRLNKLKSSELYQDEMLEHTDVYLDVAYETMSSIKDPRCFVEVKVDYSAYAPEGFGTCDCIILGVDKLIIIDFKYGVGIPVDAQENSQLMLYALGAYQTYSLLYGFKTVEMVVVQPRLDNVSRWEITMEGLLAWGESLKPIAKQAFDGVGEFLAGEHCRWCRVKAKCKARAESFEVLYGFNSAVPPLLTNDQLGAVLTKAQGLLKWVTDLEEYTLTAILRGESVRGWKAVEGRSNRIFSDVEVAFKELIAQGIDAEALYVKKPIPMGETEKLVGKKNFKEWLADKGLIIKPKGKPTLAQSEDKREAFVRDSAEDDFIDYKEEV